MAKINKQTQKKIETVSGLTLRGHEKEDYASYDGFLYHEDERRHVIEVKSRKGKYTLNLLESKETIVIDTVKIEKLALISYINHIKATIFIETADGHMIMFRLTNEKGDYLIDESDKRFEPQPRSQENREKQMEPITHLKIVEGTVYLFEGDLV